MKTLIILGDDKITGVAAKKIHKNSENIIYIDRSNNIHRIIKLLKKGVLSPLLLAKMIASQLTHHGKRPTKDIPGITSNSDLLNIISILEPDRIMLFRAGLIINEKVLNTGIPILNIHAATVPAYGGIGSIDKAIKDKAYRQHACLHIVTSKIDQGRILDKECYQLDPHENYCENERIAYRAALILLLRAIEKNYYI
jgi:folate-dependent phosphoribosylglycinamide formyltransferase PurN